FGLRHGTAGGNRLLAGVLRRARLYDRALTAAEGAASARRPVGADAEGVAPLDAGAPARPAAPTPGLARVAAGARAAEARLGRKLYAVNPSQPGPTHLRARGVVTARGEVVSPGVPSALGRAAGGRGLPPDAPEGQRRADVARRVSDPA